MSERTNLRVLLVEDDAADARIFRRYAAASTLYRIELDHALTGEKALGKLSRRDYDLVFIDQKLGGDLTGIELLKRVSDAGRQLLPIVLTGIGGEELAVASMKAGAVDYLIKESFDCEILERSIRYALHERTSSRERMRAERELGSLLQLHQTTVATIPSSLIVLDGALNVLMANHRYLEINDVGEAQVVGKHITDVFPASLLSKQSLLERIRAVAAAGGHDELSGISHMSNAHPEKHLNVRICGIPQGNGADGVEPRVLLVIDDVTEQRILEEQLRQTAKLESIGRLAGGVAHDFNNILTGIIGYTKFALANTQDDSDAHGDLVRIGDLAERAARLTSQLLAFSRKQPVHATDVTLNSLVEDMFDMLRRPLREDIDLEFTPAEAPGCVRADPGQIEQVLINLVTNAADAMPNGGTLTIEADSVVLDEAFARNHPGVESGSYETLAVTDTGCGMDEEMLEHIFDPFFTTKGPDQGTGLGLASVYGIVKQHGGSILVESFPWKGTTFRIYLPRVEAQGSHVPGEVSGAAYDGTETILLVEDEREICAVATRALRQKGYTVAVAASPTEAEQVMDLRGGEVSLLVTDVVLPQCNGRVLYDCLKSKYPTLKVLYISGYDESAAADRGVTVQGMTFLPKPFTPEVLARKVRDVLEDAQNSDDTAVQGNRSR